MMQAGHRSPTRPHLWDAPKLDAISRMSGLASCVMIPLLQMLSVIHRALLWHSPLSWFLHQRIVRVAEEASDDAALAVTSDRASYAELLLEFMQRGIRGTNWMGVPMARYGRADQRILRILDGKTLSRGVTRWTVAAIVALSLPIAYVVAAVRPQGPATPAGFKWKNLWFGQNLQPWQSDGYLNRGLRERSRHTDGHRQTRIDGPVDDLEF